SRKLSKAKLLSAGEDDNSKEEARDFVPTRGRVPKRVKAALSDAATANPQSEMEQQNGEMVESHASPVASEQLNPEPSPASSPSQKETSPVESPVATPKPVVSRKSRSRRRKSSVAKQFAADVSKLFICQVLGCEKRFRRSEHLKRHARSL